MKFLFVVQGEGRGHLTQAITLREMLERNGHEVVGVMVGKSKRRELPEFFEKSIGAPVYRFESPNFLPVDKSKKTSLLKSFAYNVFKVATFFKSSLFIRKQIKELEADVVVNFYELLVGLTYMLFPPKVPYVCIGHQYILLHPDFEFPKTKKIELFFLKFFTNLTCVKASRLLALSIQKMNDFPQKNITVVPPLIRKEVLRMNPGKGDYLHGYMLNYTYADEVLAFHKDYPDIPLQFFWDKKDADKITTVDDNLIFHRLNDFLFISLMASCRAYATTAGFESVCEAIYLEKPVLMVPTHIEQECNAYDAALSGAGIVSDNFDLKALIDYIPRYQPNKTFRTWAQQSEWYMLRELNCKKEELLDMRLGYGIIFENLIRN